MNDETEETVSSQFLASASEIDTIFESFRDLHKIYASSFENIEKSLDTLPLQYQKQVKNVHKAFENTSGTVKNKQIMISNQLYTQGLVLLIGNAESLTREMFRVLLRLNIRKINIKKSLDIPLSEVLKANNDHKLANVVLSILEAEGNPAEKMNFQNMKQMQGILKSYLGIEIGDELVKALHEYWQIRHVVIHNASIIDEQFIHNLSKAKISTARYSLGAKVKVTKKEYEMCFALLALMFETFDNETERRGLKYITG